MNQTLSTSNIFSLLDRLSEARTMRLFFVALQNPGSTPSRAHIYAQDERDARRRVIEISPDACIISITSGSSTL